MRGNPVEPGSRKWFFVSQFEKTCLKNADRILVPISPVPPAQPKQEDAN